MKHCREFVNYRQAVVLVQYGETDEEAWRRHISMNPEDRNVDVRIFHRQSRGCELPSAAKQKSAGPRPTKY
ncbi:MAG: hypothetical protein QME75_09195 [Deltaproteobacteria bacterium]|nr:hypothetical protein [Deltaproteobacteria bacterium]